MQAATRIGIHLIFFVRFIFISFPKVSRNFGWWNHFFTKTQSYSPQNSTKRHTDVFMRMFWNTYTENFGKYPEKCIYCSSNTRLKVPLKILFLKCSKKKGYSKISKFPRSFRKCVPFSFTLQACEVKFPTSIKTPQQKVFPVSFVRKQCKWRHFIK